MKTMSLMCALALACATAACDAKKETPAPVQTPAQPAAQISAAKTVPTPAVDMKQVCADLQAAYNGESNASAKYKFYAEKAAAEGYVGAAALFNATSFAESVHAKKQAGLIKSLFNEEAVCDIKLPEYTDMTAALQDGIKGETYEFDVMYPGFLKNAEAAKADAQVVSAFRWPMEAEKDHAKMYKTVMESLPDWKKEHIYTVCPVCGFTHYGTATEACPLCGVPAEMFKVFK